MELQAADTYWSSVVQGASFAREIKAIKNKHLPKSSPLLDNISNPFESGENSPQQYTLRSSMAACCKSFTYVNYYIIIIFGGGTVHEWGYY